MGIKERIKELIYLRRELDNRIDNEIEEVLRERGRDDKELKESLEWVLEERLWK